MRKTLVLCGAAAMLAAISAAPARAQFQAPNPDELKMTSDPKAPGAAAVYLDIEETDNSSQESSDYYARIKVLTEKGKDAASVEITYPAGVLDVGSIRARTVHSDGTIIPLNVKPEDLLEIKTGDYRRQRKVFTLPSVEVGSILEYAFQVRHAWSAPEWLVQQEYFVHKAHYMFVPYDQDLVNLIWWPNLPEGAMVKKDVAGRFTLDVSDVPPAPDEEWMPPIESVLYKVRFYYASRYHPLDVDDYWKAEAREWSKDIDKFAEPTKPIHDAVNGLISPSDSDLDKAKKLYKAVQSLDNTDFSRAKTESERRQLRLKEPKRAEDTWTQKSGNRQEIALLYLAMLRAAGLTAYAMQVVNRDLGVFDASYMSLWQLDDNLVILSMGGKETVLDPGEKMCPFGVVNWKHSHAQGLRQSADGPGRAVTPSQVFGSNTIRRSGDLALDQHGGVTGSLQIVMIGQDALAWRQTSLKVDAGELKKEFDRDLEQAVPEGVEAHVDHFLGLDDPDSLLMAVVKVTGTLGAATAKRLILPGFFFETRESEPFVNEETRLEPIDMHYASQVTEQLTYDLPAGAVVEGAPPDTKVSWEGHAMYIVKTQSSAGEVTVARVLARAFDLARPLDYQDLRSFYQKLAAADQGQLVFTIPASQKGL
ncbi:MAG TPA: DUF3857 domain-containing protein [Terracidiphilus sp.]|jgi:hypothetical protein